MDPIRTSAAPKSVLRFEDAAFDYEPYPIGTINGLFAPEVYEELLSEWPPLELFEYKPALGRKYSLSEVNHPESYHRFLRAKPVWKRLYEEIKLADFAHRILDFLQGHGIDLGLRSRPVSRRSRANLAQRMILPLLEQVLNRHHLSTRFEFSMLPADGGCIKPHTDSPHKHVTLVVFMLRDGEWKEHWGGETAVLRPKNPKDTYNHLNRQLGFDQVDTIRTCPMAPNRGVVFVKTFNSLHAVRPMNGPPDAPMRRTLTITLESRQRI